MPTPLTWINIKHFVQFVKRKDNFIFSSGKMSTIQARLREFVETNFSSQKEFADKIGMSPQSVTAYLSGRRIPGGIFQRKLRELGADVDYIMTGESRLQKFIQEQRASYHTALDFYPVISEIQKINSPGGARFTFTTEVTMEGPAGSRYNGSFYFKIADESMRPRWQPGDYILVNPNSPPVSGDYALICFEEKGYTVRRVFFDGDSAILQSLDLALPPVTISRKSIWFSGKILSTLHT